MIKLSASEIYGMLVYGARMNAFMPAMVTAAIQQGRIIHARLGFTNSKIFSRYLKIDKKIVLITGMPDRIDEEFVYELKTYHSAQAKAKNLKAANIQIQVYGFITGLKRGKIVLYDTGQDKITDEIETEFNQKDFQKVIKKALQLKMLTEKFQKQYKEMQKEETK